MEAISISVCLYLLCTKSNSLRFFALLSPSNLTYSPIAPIVLTTSLDSSSLLTIYAPNCCYSLTNICTSSYELTGSPALIMTVSFACSRCSSDCRLSS